MWGRLFGELIINGKYEYGYVIEKRPDLKTDIDLHLTNTGNENLITG